jgi:HAMP domain-containing protein
MPAYWRLRSLRLRLLLAMLGVALSAIGLSAGISGWQQYQATLASNQSELAALAELLGNRSAAALAFGDAQLAEENVAALAGLPQIAKGCLYDGTDQLLAGFARPGSGLRCPSRSRDTEASPMRVVRPVLANGAEVGHVLLHFDASLLAQRQREQLLNATIALLLAIFPAMGLALLLQRRITRPLALVREVAEAVVAKRDFNLRAPVPRDDEIGSLAHSFNSMLDTLQAQARQLEAESAYNSLLFRDSPIPIVLADRKSGLIVDCNDAAVAAYGRSSREAVIGLTPADVSAPIQYDGRPSQEHFPEAYGDLQRTGSRTFEWLHRRAPADPGNPAARPAGAAAQRAAGLARFAGGWRRPRAEHAAGQHAGGGVDLRRCRDAGTRWVGRRQPEALGAGSLPGGVRAHGRPAAAQRRACGRTDPPVQAGGGGPDLGG